MRIANDGMSSLRRTLAHRLCGWMLAVVLIGPVAAKGEPAEAVALPPFLVEETGRPLRWHYVRVPGLELLTTCSPSVARSFVETYLRQTELVRLLIPDHVIDPVAEPMVILLIDAATSERVTDETMAKVLLQNPPQTRNRRDSGRVLPNLRLSDRDSTIVLTLRQKNAPREVTFALAPGWLRFRLPRVTPSLPLWLAAGLMGFYETCAFTTQTVQIDSTTWRSPEEVAAMRADPDWPREVQPLARLFGALPAEDPESRRAWAEQAALFVRWALLADNRARQDGLWRFVDHCMAGPPTEAVFRDCFGMGFSEARDRLSDYLPVAVQDWVELKPADASPAPAIVSRPATPLDVGRLRGEWERLEVSYARQHHPDLVPAYLDQARATITRARRLAGDEPALRAVSGLIEYDAGNLAAAREELEIAVAMGETRPLACYALARLRYDEARAGVAADARMTPEQTGLVLAPLAQARDWRPALPEAFVLLGDVWINSEMTPTPEDLAVLAEGSRLFPLTPALVGRAALLHAGYGQLENALAMVAASMAKTPDEVLRLKFEQMIAPLHQLADMK